MKPFSEMSKGLGPRAKPRAPKLCLTILPNDIKLCTYLIMLMHLAWTGHLDLVCKLAMDGTHAQPCRH